MSIHFRRKNLQELVVADVDSTTPTLERTLSGLNIVLLGVGGIIGAGIYVLTGQAAASYAGPAIVLSFILSGIACTFAALCYAELASMIPVAGSAYTYAYATLGQLCAWIIGWDLMLEYLFGAATVAVGWSGYLVSFLRDLNVVIPKEFVSAPILFNAKSGEWMLTGSYINLPAVLICLAVTGLLVKGIKESAQFNNFIVFIKIGILILFILLGLSYISPSNWVPFIPENTGTWGEYGVSGIFRGAAVIFFAYVGFDSVSTLAQEAKNPQRDMPIGIIGSLLISTIFYIVVSLVLTGIVNYKSLGVPDPIAVAVNAMGDSVAWIRPLIKIGIIAGLSSVVMMLLMAQARIFYIMAKDGFLPKGFSKVHPTFRTPYITTVVCGCFAACAAGLFPIDLLGELVSIGTLFAFVIVCIGVFVLRKTNPDAERPFKVKYVGIVTLLGALGALGQMLSLPLDTWWRLGIWMAIGLVIYFGYGCKRVSRT
jgi:basic amino acid/polyamine antiporter, APA family